MGPYEELTSCHELTYSNERKPNVHTVEKTDRGRLDTTREFFSCRLNNVRYQRSNDAANHATGIQRARECARLLSCGKHRQVKGQTPNLTCRSRGHLATDVASSELGKKSNKVFVIKHGLSMIMGAK